MRARLAPLSFGNFVVGTGGFIVAGLLNELTADLQVSIVVAGQLLTGYSLALAIGAPLLAWLTTRIDRRTLLTGCLFIYALLHFAAALAPGYGWLAVLRVLTGAVAAIVTPQAVATAGLMVKPEERGSAIGMVFLGFSLSSVLGVPLGSLIGAHYGWRVAFWMIGGLSMAGAAWMWLTIPARLYVAPMDRQAWAKLGGNPVVLLLVATTVVHATGQFALFSYLAPALKEAIAASPRMVSMVFLWFGVAGVIGNMVAVKYINRLGSPLIILVSMGSMLAGLMAWSFAHGSLAGVLASILLWGLGCFATNMSQQARLVAVAPSLASASVALNSSAIYLGQALGSVSGGVMIGFSGMHDLNWLGALLMAVAIGMAVWTGRLTARQAAAA